MYTGSDNIRGFFRVFELWCSTGDFSDADQTAALCCALGGDARDFLHNSSQLGTATYAELKQELLDNFGRQEKEHLSKLC